MKTNVKVVSHTSVDREMLTSLGYVEHEWETGTVTGFDTLHEYAGRTCYLSYDRPNPKTATNRTYLANIIKQGHFSIFSHTHVTFVVDCSRSCSHEIARHIFLGKSETSQRYIDPIKILSTVGADIGPFVNHLAEYGRVYAEEQERNPGKVKSARGAARQELPLGFPTRLVLSGNFRAWRDFLWQRLSPTADKEIREVALGVLDELEYLGPNSIQDIEKEYHNDLEDYRSRRYGS